MKWSSDQYKAIVESGKSILVNAGAGSGKTAVLTERLLQKVTNGIKLENLIILTFSVLAAGEMKERLRKALLKSTHPFAKLQLEYIDQANIQTFDAFTNELVKKYHYLLNIPSSINIVNNTDFMLVELNIMNEIFTEYYEQNNQQFNEFIDKFSIKNDADIINYCLKLYSKIRLNSNYVSLLKNYSLFYQQDYLDRLINIYISNIEKKMKELDIFLKELEKYTSDKKLYDHFNKLQTGYNELKCIKSYEDAYLILSWKFPTIPTKVEDEEEKESYKIIYEEFKKRVENIKKYLIYENTNELANSYLASKNDALVIANILLKLDKSLQQYKTDNNCYDFTDIALMAIKVLEENREIRESIKKNTCEILIDEYQDTSDLQEHLINLIASNNVYMVGDVKQSIYRFRNANPNIFKSKYQVLKNTPPNMVIDLSLNFRSRPQVLESVNLIFMSLMSELVGGVEYDKTHQLNYGFKRYDECNFDNYDMEVLKYDLTSEENNEYKIYEKSEIEAFIIGRDILSKVNNYHVYDKENDTYRLSQFKDFAILVPDKSKMEIYIKVFEYLGIPLKTYKDTVLTKNNDIYAVFNLMKLIYCFNDSEYCLENLKEVLTSVLRSFIYKVDDSVICEIITSKECLDKFKNLCPELYQKCTKIASVISQLTLSQILEEIYIQFDIYEKMLSLSLISDVEYRLNYVHQMMKSLTNLNYTYQDMLEYFQTLISSNDFEIKISPLDSSTQNVVKMMTIHLSKGLEFPICYFPELYKEFNFKEMNELISYSKEYKFIIPFEKDQLLKKSITKFLEEENYRLEEVSEKIRLLYVALTRPREKIILVLPASKKTLLNILTDSTKITFKSFKDMFDKLENKLQSYIKNISLNELKLSKSYQYKTEIIETLKIPENELSFFDFNLSKIETNKIHASISSINYRSKDELELLNKGTKFHKLLEITDFTNPNYDELDYQDEIIIKNFINHPFIKSLDIINTYHEYNFIYQDKDDIINGVIDLIIETEDAFYIIDYKLSNLDKDDYHKQLNVYKKYLNTVVYKPVYTYLYSINKNQFLKI